MPPRPNKFVEKLLSFQKNGGSRAFLCVSDNHRESGFPILFYCSDQKSITPIAALCLKNKYKDVKFFRLGVLRSDSEITDR